MLKHKTCFEQSAKDKDYYNFIIKLAHLLRDHQHIETDFRMGMLIEFAMALMVTQKNYRKKYSVDFIKKDGYKLLFDTLKTIPDWYVGKEKDYKGWSKYVDELERRMGLVTDT